MNNFRSTVLDPPITNDQPPQTYRPRRRRRYRDKRKKCPYCLFDLTDFDPKEQGPDCPLCRHAILEHLLTTPVHEFTRVQQWDLLANEMEYIWDGEHRDVDSYLFGMGQYYNPDYTDAKDRLGGMFAEKEALLRLVEEFLEAEGELDLLMIAHLNKIGVWRGDMARRLFAGHQWRRSARRLSLSVPSERERVEFQLGLIMATPWGAFGYPGEKGKTVAALEEILRKLSWDQENFGA